MTWKEVSRACREIPVLMWGYRTLRLAMGALILVCLKAARPFVNVRLGLLRCDRIGHLASNSEYWLRKQYPKRRPDEKFILLAPEDLANHQLVAMIGRVVPVIKSSILYGIVSAANRRWPRLSIWSDFIETGGLDYDLWKSTGPQLAFTSEEVLRGQELLRAMGIAEGAPFVCFAMRDKAYLETQQLGLSWRYHDYRDVDIDNCRLMAEWLASRGIWVLRMGAVVEKSFGADNPRIIDYANHYRSDFGDIFLLGHCKFFVGDTAGIFWPACILGVPVALTNQVPITHLCPVPGSMVMPKKYYRSVEGDLLGYREVVESRLDGLFFLQDYEQAGISLLENTPEEILGMVQEMNARIDGTWESTSEDEDLHAQFWSVFPEGHPSHGCPARVPIDFLRRNRGLLA